MRRLRSVLASAALLIAACATHAGNTEPLACLAADPNQWPAAAKPYFLIIADSSASMSTSVGTSSSCGSFGSSRHAHARCALARTYQSFDGLVQFGFATYAMQQIACTGSCYSGCLYNAFSSETSSRGTSVGCGPLLAAGAANASGATIRVALSPDDYWATPPSAPNSGDLLGWVDNICTGNTELFAGGTGTPLNGSLRDARRYFAGTYLLQDGVTPVATPLSNFDYTGGGVNGGTGCRSLNVILITDGDESCDTQADAVAAATALYGTGVTVGGRTFKIRVHVINLAGATQANADQIAAAGGTGTAYLAANETDLMTALRSIVSGSLSNEVGDNLDNNCNSCTDEGFAHYRNTNASCCAWATVPQRQTCLNNFSASINPGNPQGNRNLLPCTSAIQAIEPSTWLIHNPGDSCDNVDNNGDGQVDEGQLKCGNPLHCPSAEICNGSDDDCDGVVDEGGVCPGGQQYSSEVCDGCDNDLDGSIDDLAQPLSIPCGQPTPANCVGTVSCKPAIPSVPGSCAAGSGLTLCSFNPQTEVCDGVDNNCNAVVDDGVAAVACVAPGTPPGLNYGPNSRCRQGNTRCSNGMTVCEGMVGPVPEVCNGIDDDCNNSVDETFPDANSSCGVIPGFIFDQAPSQCRSGTLQCGSGTLACAGVVGPSGEILGDGIDNNCNGVTDENDIFGNGFE